MAFTIADLQSTSLKLKLIRYERHLEEIGAQPDECRRRADEVQSCVLDDEAIDFLLTEKPRNLLKDCGITIVDNDEVYFVTDDSTFAMSGCLNLPEGKRLIGCTYSMPMRVTPRESLPSGWVTTIDELFLIFYKDENLRRINSDEELLAYLNSFQDHER